ncbi:MAG: phospho-N-acetylmuramoyl-pentapeptide-transferase [Eubacterium sp.]|nr:phospho-N-acetylmuramoyl-pentapeptide-transferase [Eubacterium sp.]
MQNLIIFAIILSFVIVLAMGPFMIPFLIKLKVGNTEREELESHQKKTGTPTMGGVMIIAAIVITSLVFLNVCPDAYPVVFLIVGFGVIGFIDDFLKVVKKKSDGLLAKQKMLLQIIVTAVFAYFMHSAGNLGLLIPFSGGYVLDIGILAYPLLFFAVIGTVNGVNFTDGVDGLASTVTLVVAGFFLIAGVIKGSGTWPVDAAVIGALMGFLVYNCYPAKVFMGDTGSLALGGYVAGAAYMMQMPIFIIIIGLIYLVEVLSVMIQVTYFKKTGGKRIFRMAPIHHHFELGGWSETKVVAIFSIFTAIMCLIALLGI